MLWSLRALNNLCMFPHIASNLGSNQNARQNIQKLVGSSEAKIGEDLCDIAGLKMNCQMNSNFSFQPLPPTLP